MGALISTGGTFGTCRMITGKVDCEVKLRSGPLGRADGELIKGSRGGMPMIRRR